MKRKSYNQMRAEMGMTQREVAKELGMTSSNYCYIENHKRSFSVEKAIDFARLYMKKTGNKIDFINDIKHI